MDNLATKIVKTLKSYQEQLEKDNLKGVYWTYQQKGYKQLYEEALSSGNRTLNCVILYNWILRTLKIIPNKGLINHKNGMITYANADVKKAAKKYFDEIKMGDTQINLAKKGKLQKGDLLCHNGHFAIFVKYENGKLITGDAGRGNCSPVAIGGKFKKFYGESPCPNMVVTYILRPKDSVKETNTNENKTEKEISKTEIKNETNVSSIVSKGDDSMALVGSTNEEKIWNYLLDKIGNEFGVAGCIGNLFAESGLDPTSVEMLLVQRYDEDKIKYPNISYLQGWKRPVDNEANRTANNKKYLKLLDDGIITKEEFLHPRSYTGKQYRYGFCLHQITSPSRKEKFYDYVKQKGKSFGNLNVQLQYLVKELKSDYPFVWSVLKNAKSVKEASDVVLTKFEIPADCSNSVKNLRASYGQEYYNKYASNKKTSTNSSNITDISNSNIKTEQQLVIEKALSYVGTKESPANSNNVIFNTHYYGGAVNDPNLAWCCAYVWDVFRMVGLSHLFYDGQKTAYCPTVLSWAQNKGLVVNKTNAQYGDIVLFDWNYDGVADHIGFIIEYKNGVFYTVEGNTSTGNDSNGGQVMRRERNASSIIAIVRPKYGTKHTSTTTSSSNSKTSSTTSNTTSTSTSTTSKGSHTVIADSLNVRTWAGTSYPTCSFSPLLEGTKVDVEYTIDAADGTGGKWSLINYNGLKGFVLAEWIE